MPLFVAEVEITVVIEAPDERSATRAAEGYVKEEVRWNGCDTHSVWPLTKQADIPAGWDDGLSQPYGASKGESVLAMVKRLEREEAAKPPTTEQLEAAGQQRLNAV